MSDRHALLTNDDACHVYLYVRNKSLLAQQFCFLNAQPCEIRASSSSSLIKVHWDKQALVHVDRTGRARLHIALTAAQKRVQKQTTQEYKRYAKYMHEFSIVSVLIPLHRERYIRDGKKIRLNEKRRSSHRRRNQSSCCYGNLIGS